METKGIYKALANIMQEVNSLPKNGWNTNEKYKYLQIDDLYEMLHPLFAKNRVFLSHEVIATKESTRKARGGWDNFYIEMTIKINFITDDGSSHSVITQSHAMDNGDKAYNKAITAAYKYALIPMFLLVTGEKIDTENEQEPDKETKKTPNPDPWGEIHGWLKENIVGITSKEVKRIDESIYAAAGSEGLKLPDYIKTYGLEVVINKAMGVNQ
jgi:hypothetical protein